MTNRIHILSAALLLAGCSLAAQEAPNTAIVMQSGPQVGGAQIASAFDSPPSPLQAPAPVVPPVLMRGTEPLPPPVIVKQAAQRVTCDIEVHRTSTGVRLTPVVRSNRLLSGEFSLVVTKDGAGGSSDITQGGPFDAARGERVELSSSEFSMERGATFRAVLKVRAGGDVICRDIRS